MIRGPRHSLATAMSWGCCSRASFVITELATHLRRQLVAAHPAVDVLADSFAAPSVRGNPDARQAWAVRQLELAAKASRQLGADRHVTFSGSYLNPQWPEGLMGEGFDEPARRWRPI